MILKKVGYAKKKDFTNNFDEIYDSFLKKAKEMGYEELKFVVERGKVLFYVELETLSTYEYINPDEVDYESGEDNIGSSDYPLSFND